MAMRKPAETRLKIQEARVKKLRMEIAVKKSRGEIRELRKKILQMS